jgi:hypothetical protein
MAGIKLDVQQRRLMLLFDRTWNDKSSMTNIGRMFEAIDDYKLHDYDVHSEDYKRAKQV